MKKTTITLLLGSLIATGVSADCDDDTNNLMQNDNCDFTSDVSNWTAVSGIINHSAVDDFLLGAGSAGSAHVISQNTGFSESVRIESACIAVPDTMIRSAGIWIKGDPIEDLSCGIISFDFSDASCTTGGNIIGGINNFAVAAGSGWTNTNYVVTPTASSDFTYMRITCSNTEIFNIEIDNAYIVQQGGLPVELQSFSVE